MSYYPTQHLMSSDTFETTTDQFGSKRFTFFHYLCCNRCWPTVRVNVDVSQSLITVQRQPLGVCCNPGDTVSVGMMSKLRSITTGRAIRGGSSRAALAISLGAILVGLVFIIVGSVMDTGSCGYYNGYNWEDDDNCSTGIGLWASGIPIMIVGAFYVLIASLCGRRTAVRMSGLDEGRTDLFSLYLPERRQAERMRQSVLELKQRTDPLVLHHSLLSSGVVSGGAAAPGAPPMPEALAPPSTSAPYYNATNPGKPGNAV